MGWERVSRGGTYIYTADAYLMCEKPRNNSYKAIILKLRIIKVEKLSFNLE